jgi:hypothetical protein
MNKLRTRPKRNLKHSRARWLVIAFGALAVALAPRGEAQVIAPSAAYDGQTYSQWSAAWWQWNLSLTPDDHPLFDTADASVGNSGSVWFLGGTFGASGVESRSCLVPQGTALFFPIVNIWADNTDCPQDSYSEDFLRGEAAAFQDQATNMSCTIDGVPVSGLSNGLTTAYRVQSPVFTYTVPGSNNLLNYFGLPCYVSNSPILINADAVADGVYLMVAPLSVGAHTIHFQGESGSPATFSDDITYNITVVDTNVGYAGIYAPNTTPFGQSYSQWSGSWFQWQFALESTHNPDTGTADLSAGQAGSVWFLGGTWGTTPEPVVRTGVVPQGKALCFPVVTQGDDNSFCDTSTTNCGINGCPAATAYTPAELLSYIEPLDDAAFQNMGCTVDGIPVAGVAASNSIYRVQSIFNYSYVPPHNNLFEFSEGEPCYDNGDPDAGPAEPFTLSGNVQDGVFLLLQPLPIGPHSIHFFAPTFGQDVTYEITVTDTNLGNPNVFPPDSMPYGKTYGQWAAAHWQWLYSLPANHNPLFDTADVSAGQTGDVWFLGGTYTTTATTNGTILGAASRNCTIPEGKALFFPIVDAESAIAEGSGTDFGELFASSQALIDHVSGVSCMVDGQAVQNIVHYRAQSPEFTWGPLPSNNVVAVSSGDFADYTNGLTSPSVADGYYLMLQPLADGSHTIHFTGAINLSVANGDPFDFSFQLDITYNLTVAPTNGVFPGSTTLYGKTYSDYSAGWWQWNFSLPTTNSPIQDTAPINTGQFGHVWFLGGTFGTGSGTRVRSGNVPEGTSLFFPIVDAWADDADCPVFDSFDTATLRGFAQSYIDPATNMTCVIDGVAVGGLSNSITSQYRVQSPVFGYTAPAAHNYLYDLFGATCFTNDTGTPFTVDGAVADGIYLMVAPLPVGQHTIHFTGDLSGFYEDITYNLNVTQNSYTLTVSRQGGQAMIAWPQASNYVLEATGSLSNPDWEPAGLPVQAVDGQFQVALPVGSGAQFFRLHLQP